MCGQVVCGQVVCVVKLCGDQVVCVCVQVVCVSKLCGGKLCVCVSKRRAAERQGQAGPGGSAQPKTRTPHKDVGKKHRVSGLFHLLAHADPLFSYVFSSDSLASLTFRTSAALSVHNVGSLTSKFPSIITRMHIQARVHKIHTSSDIVRGTPLNTIL